MKQILNYNHHNHNILKSQIVSDKKGSKPNIVVITHPFTNIAGASNLSHLLEVLKVVSNQIFVITGNFPQVSTSNIHIIRMKGDEKRESILIRIVKYVLTELRISYALLKISENVNIDIVAFHVGAQGYLLPKLFSKLAKNKIVVFSFASRPRRVNGETFSKRMPRLGAVIFSYILQVLLEISFSLSDQIAVESESCIKFSELNRYRSKISIYGAKYIDFQRFKMTKNLRSRGNLVGYVGRLSEEKGVMNFIKAIPIILKENKDVKFFIGGGGTLFNEIEGELNASKLYNRVMLAGWIPDNVFSDYLNELKLLVLPSYVEGLPGIVQQAMACGTPVLATSVGGIPDLIKDGETGFIMKNNDSECIAENVIRVLEHSNLDEIAKNARELVEREFTYEATVEKYKKILSCL